MDAVKPKYSIGQTVKYRDHTNRLQVGKVKRIEATWRAHSWSDDVVIYISVDVTHPTYKNNVMHINEGGILEAAP